MSKKFCRSTFLYLISIGTIITILTTCEKPERVISFITVEALDADISYTSATLKGEIIDAGSQPVDDYGIVYSTDPNPRIGNGTPKSAGTSLKKGEFSITVTGLDKNTKYYFRAYVTIDDDDIHADKINSFTTKDTQVPTVTGGSVTEITMASASLSGEVTSDGGETNTTRGLCWGTSASLTLTSCLDTTVNGSGTGTFTGKITGLTAGTQYYARTYATNSKGTTYNSADIIFKTHSLPLVTTTAVSDISGTTASSGGEVTDTGGVAVTARGVCWGTATEPTEALATKTIDGSGIGAFTSNITGLTVNTGYYVRAYATNKYGTSYGSELTFSTMREPGATTAAATGITTTSAILNGSVNANNSETAVSFQYGTTTSYGSTIAATPSTVTGNVSTAVSAALSSLTPGTTYHYRVRALSEAGEIFGDDQEFTTLKLPSATTLSATTVTGNTATLNGTINANNSSTTVTFEYGLTTAYGTEVAAAQNPVTGTTNTSVSADISGLTSGVTYHFRVKAVNGGGTTYGSDLTFTTLQPPAATTEAASAVLSTAAILNGTVNTYNKSAVVIFEYGTTESYGTEITADQSPVTSGTAVPVSASVSGLSATTTYHYRVKAESPDGTAYGDDITFATTSSIPTVTDFDGNIYNIIIIGTQEWMQKNLMVTHYSNGDAIPNITDNAAWEALTSGAFCWYDNDEATYRDTYGAQYNWYTAADVRNVCPARWHVPTEAEWATLENYLVANGYNYDGTTTDSKTAKSLAATTNWAFSATEGAVGNTDYPEKRNATGFTALPGGVRSYNGIFDALGSYGFWWSSADYSSTKGGGRTMYYGYVSVYSHETNRKNGISIRCIKGVLPLSETSSATALTSTSITLNGKVNPNGASTSVTFEYGISTAYGSSVVAIQSPALGFVSQNVSASLTSLIPGTTYHYRVKAENSGGTVYGNDMTFTTPALVADSDGNVYNTVIIGTQIWMKENLITRKYNDNTNIPNVTDNAAWEALTTPGYCWYNNDKSTYGDVYGALYNWYAVNTGKLCPTGWHVPSDAEWTTMENYLIVNGYNYDGTTTGNKIAKSLAATTNWVLSANEGAVGNTDYPAKRNATSFTALPGGWRIYDGTFSSVYNSGWWWTSTDYTVDAWHRDMGYSFRDVFRNHHGMEFGLSVRCIKD